MPSKRSRRAQEKQRVISDELLDWFAELSSEEPGDYHFFTTESEQLAMWKACEPQVLEQYVGAHPGRRPQTWWQFSSPRAAWPGCYFDGKLPEMRRHVSGAGAAPWDAGYRLIPNVHRHGIPGCWAGFNTSDPPVFESEATYLRRHELFLSGEEKRIPEREFEDVVEIDFAEIPPQVMSGADEAQG